MIYQQSGQAALIASKHEIRIVGKCAELLSAAVDYPLASWLIEPKPSLAFLTI